LNLPGINIQYPISVEIISGRKIIETRTYDLPKKYLGKDIFLVETPGKSGKFKARITGVIRFTSSWKYKSKKDFYNDSFKHLVDASSQWAWSDKPKWGWSLEVIKVFETPILAPQKRGIIFSSMINIS